MRRRHSATTCHITHLKKPRKMMAAAADESIKLSIDETDGVINLSGGKLQKGRNEDRSDGAAESPDPENGSCEGVTDQIGGTQSYEPSISESWRNVTKNFWQICQIIWKLLHHLCRCCSEVNLIVSNLLLLVLKCCHFITWSCELIIAILLRFVHLLSLFLSFLRKNNFCQKPTLEGTTDSLPEPEHSPTIGSMEGNVASPTSPASVVAAQEQSDSCGESSTSAAVPARRKRGRPSVAALAAEAAAAKAQAAATKQEIRQEVLEVVRRSKEPADTIEAYGQYLTASLRAMPHDIRSRVQGCFTYIIEMATPPNNPYEVIASVDQSKLRFLQGQIAAGRPAPPPPTPSPESPYTYYGHQSRDLGPSTVWQPHNRHFERSGSSGQDWAQELPSTSETNVPHYHNL